MCLQKEQENRVAMELQILSVEEQLETLSTSFSACQQDRDALIVEVERQKSENKVCGAC